MRWRRLTELRRQPRLKIALLASFTIDPLVPHLGVHLEDEGFPAQIHVGPFDQIPQECLSDHSATALLRPDVLVVWARWEDLWRGLPLPLRAPAAPYIEAANDVVSASLTAARRWNATLLFVLPTIPEQRPLGMGDACNSVGVVATATAGRETLRARLAGEAGVLLFDAEEALRVIGSARSYNPRLFTFARIPFSEELHSELGRRMARLIRVGQRAAPKVVVVDCDNTLWGGVVAEDGSQCVALTEGGPGSAYRDFQVFLQELRRAGVLLALCSKNQESDIWEVFARREMCLRREDLAAYRIGWQSKAAGLRAIAEELNVGLDSLVFIDDNPAEIAEVETTIPNVSCILMPTDPAEWLSAIQEAGVLDRLPPTHEDVARAQFYDEERLRKEELAATTSPEDYRARLGISVDIFLPRPADIQRLTQLIHKTNQLNLNGRRRSEAALAAMLEDPRFVFRLVSAMDRFGDYGVVGAYIIERASDCATLDTFLLSCRAMGRGIEEAMIADIFKEAAPLEHVLATVIELPRNEPARQFFAQLGCQSSGAAHALGKLDWPPYIARTIGSSQGLFSLR